MDIVKTLICNPRSRLTHVNQSTVVESCVKDTKESCQRFWRHKLDNSFKLTFYTSIKEDYKLA